MSALSKFDPCLTAKRIGELEGSLAYANAKIDYLTKLCEELRVERRKLKRKLREKKR